jgi:hypothetical protein
MKIVDHIEDAEMRAGPFDDKDRLVGANDQDVTVQEPSDGRDSPLGPAGRRLEVDLIDQLHMLVEGDGKKLCVALCQVFIGGTSCK